jgi:hypothetical protein
LRGIGHTAGSLVRPELLELRHDVRAPIDRRLDGLEVMMLREDHAVRVPHERESVVAVSLRERPVDRDGEPALLER